MAKIAVLVSATSSSPRIPCRRRVKCAGAVVIDALALALLAMVVVMPGAAPPVFLPSTALPIRSRQAQSQQAGRTLHMKVLAGSRKALESRGRSSRMALMAVSSSMNVAELKALCKEKGLSIAGKKADLISRLKEAEDADVPKAPANVPVKAAKVPEKAAKVPEKAAKVPEKAAAVVPEKAASPKVPEKAEVPGEMLPGDRAMARYHRDNELYPGIVLEQQDSHTWLISWDEPDENEPLTSCRDVKFLKKGKRLESGTKQIYHAGDKVSARFTTDNKWYEAQVLEVKDDTCIVRWKDPDGAPPVEEKPLADIKLVLRIKSAC